MPAPITHVIRKIFLCLDSRWQTKYKFLWDAWAAANEGYTDYVDIWDTIPWQTVVLDDGTPHDFNYAAMAQYLPSYGGSGDYYHIYEQCVGVGLPDHYCHNCLGLVGDIIALLEADGIADSVITATYSSEGSGVIAHVPLRNLFFRNFDPANICCPIVFSRPMTYNKGGPGHIGDNNQQAFFVRAVDSCDGTEGLRVTLAPDTYRHEFWADAMHFLRTVPADEIIPLLTAAPLAVPLDKGDELEADSSAKSSGGLSSARLVVYAIACGSVPRISINGTWFVVSPAYFPPYGDPYGYCFRGHKHLVGQVTDLPLHLAAGESNDFIVEHIAPLSDEIGAQVIFAIEYDEIITEEVPMAKEKKPAKGKAFGDIIDRWQIMLKNLADLLQQYPFLQGDYDALETLLADAITANAEQEKLKGQLKVATVNTNAKLSDGGKHYSNLMHFLEGIYGKLSPELTKYIPKAEGEVDKTKKGYGDGGTPTPQPK